MIQQRLKKLKDEQYELLGEPLKDEVLNEEGILEFNKLKNITIQAFTDIGIGAREPIYRSRMAEILKENKYEVEEEKTAAYNYNNKKIGNIRPDITGRNENGDFIIEIKRNGVRSGFIQLAQYLYGLNKEVGYLVVFNRSCELYMLYHNLESDDMYCTDGVKMYKLNLSRS